jgi:ABC-type polar amino acid transport system ATPase subunit
MVGLLESDSGEILYDGRNFSELDFEGRKAFRQEIGMVFQGGALFDFTQCGTKRDVPAEYVLPTCLTLKNSNASISACSG